MPPNCLRAVFEWTLTGVATVLDSRECDWLVQLSWGSLNTRDASWEKPMHSLKNMTLCHSITWSFFFYNSPKFEFMHISNDIEHYSIKLYYVTCTKYDWISVQCIFNWNTPVTDPNKGRSPYHSANFRQGQLKIPQSLSLTWYMWVSDVSWFNIMNELCSRNDLKVISKLVYPSSLTLQLICCRMSIQN